MVIILVILTVALFISVEYILRLRRRMKVEPAAGEIRYSPPAATAAERYYHPAHAWVMVKKPELLLVGMDDFAGKVIGQLDGIDLPRAGSVVHQGSPLATLKRRGKTLTSVAPISGVILEVNSNVRNNPTMINDSPYEKGWMVKISPLNLTRELRNLMHGLTAEQWLEAVRAQLLSWFAPRPGMLLQDGGHIIGNVSDLVPDDEWSSFIREFFPIGETASPSSMTEKE